MQRGPSAGNPIANIFVVIVGALAIAAFVVLGFFAFLIVASIVLTLAAIISVRLWWFKRKMRGQVPPAGEPNKPQADSVIEGEFRVVAEDNKDE